MGINRRRLPAVGRRVLEQWPVLARHGLTTLDVPFLAKPYTRGEVLAKVQQALQRPPRPDAIRLWVNNVS